MILVKLYRGEVGLMSEADTLEFYGVPVTEPDGSTWIEFDSLGEPRPGKVRLQPSGIAIGSEIRAISHALSRNELRGEAGRYEWKAE
jgi:hypothetical protein